MVREIPPGQVATYGQVAEIAGVHPRLVGQVLHRNTDPDAVPCHRVVNRKGQVAANYRFGGWKAQKERLSAEGVMFLDDNRVDLEKYRVGSKSSNAKRSQGLKW